MPRRFSPLATLLFAGLAGLAALAQTPASPKPPVPLSPEASGRSFRLPPGLRAELVACEPQIASPVAMSFDERGRLWVVEMADYPNGPRPGQKPEGRIKVLEDTDGDGRFESARTFADGLLFANGLLPWKNGAIVTAAPHVAWLRDSDGDGKSDGRDVLYQGFAAENPQLRVSHPVLGLDGWISVANGLRGGQVRRAGDPAAKPINLSGMDFRFDPLGRGEEALSGPGQFGNTIDDWGRRFVCDNRHHLRHVVLPQKALRRNPFLAAPAVLEDPSSLDEGPLYSGGKVYPLSKNWTTSSLHTGRFTAACGVLIYRGDLLPPAYRGGAFTCEPTGNLVHHEVLTPHGGSFRSRPARDGVEFLATPDDWFRPVFLAHGPDGALYVVDMGRAVIEHPEFMPPELKDRPDLTWGKDRGRIWRIVPDSLPDPAQRPRPPALAKAAVPELVAHLASPNPWVRTTAQRLLLQRDDVAALVAPLRAALSGREPLQRAHAAWLLGSLGALTAADVAPLLADPVPEVREQALQLAESFLKTSPAVREPALKLAGDPNARVRFQAALSLGEWDDDAIVSPLARIAIAGADDPWTRLAVASAVPTRAAALVEGLLRPDAGLASREGDGPRRLVHELAAVAGARRDPAEVVRLLSALDAAGGPRAAALQMAGLEGLAEGMGRRGTQLAAFLASLPPERRAAAGSADRLLAGAARRALDASSSLDEREAAARLLAHASWDTARPALTALVAPACDQRLRLAAVRALAAHPRPEVPTMLLAEWPSSTPALRREVTEALLRHPAGALALLASIEKGQVQPGDLDAARTRQLTEHARPEVRDRARRLLKDNLPAERRTVLEKYRAALSLAGDSKKGRDVFQKNCATCHKVAGQGIDVGPDIADTRTKTPDALLTDILNPNQAIDSNYVNYEVTLKSGKVLTGLIAAETAASLVLKRAENQTDQVLRQDVEEIRSTGRSLMPEGVEKTVSVEEMADLISFLKNWRYLDGSVPLGTQPPR